MTPEAKAYCEAQAHRIAELEFDNANLKAVIDRLHLDYKELEQQRDELQARANHYEVENGKQAEMLNSVIEQRDELLAAGEKAVSEMKAIAWDEEGYLLDPDLDQAADSLRAAIAKVKPVVGSQLRDGESK